MNKCFKCGTEYEGKICTKCGTQYGEEQQPVTQNSTVDTQAVVKEIFIKIKDNVLKYAPIVLFSLWAVLLWAFYAAEVTSGEFLFFDFTANLYNALKDEMFSDLFPVLNALLSFAIISNVYIAVLALIYWKGNEKVKTFANCGGILLQLAVFICALVTRSKVIEFGADNGSFVAVVSSFTCVFAVVEIVLTSLKLIGNKNPFFITKEFSSNEKHISVWDIKNPKKLVGINVETGNSVYHSTNNCLIKTKTKELILGCVNSVIPNDNSVLHLGNRAFYNSAIKKITIPINICSIGYECFQNCTNLTEIIYCGKKQQWENIYKDKHWCTNSAIKTISCKDGIIEL